MLKGNLKMHLLLLENSVTIETGSILLRYLYWNPPTVIHSTERENCLQWLFKESCLKCLSKSIQNTTHRGTIHSFPLILTVYVCLAFYWLCTFDVKQNHSRCTASIPFDIKCKSIWLPKHNFKMHQWVMLHWFGLWMNKEKHFK